MICNLASSSADPMGLTFQMVVLLSAHSDSCDPVSRSTWIDVYVCAPSDRVHFAIAFRLLLAVADPQSNIQVADPPSSQTTQECSSELIRCWIQMAMNVLVASVY